MASEYAEEANFSKAFSKTEKPPTTENLSDFDFRGCIHKKRSKSFDLLLFFIIFVNFSAQFFNERNGNTRTLFFRVPGD